MKPFRFSEHIHLQQKQNSVPPIQKEYFHPKSNIKLTVQPTGVLNTINLNQFNQPFHSVDSNDFNDLNDMNKLNNINNLNERNESNELHQTYHFDNFDDTNHEMNMKVENENKIQDNYNHLNNINERKRFNHFNTFNNEIESNEIQVLKDIKLIKHDDKKNDEIDKQEEIIQNELNDEIEMIDDVDQYEREHYLEIYEPKIVSEIYETLYSKEKYYKSSPNILQNHQHMTANHRSILLDWMFEVCSNHFNYKIETYLLSVVLLDEFILKHPSFPSKQFQLLGACILHLSMKYEEIQTNSIDDYLYLCLNEYSRDQMLSLEIEILTSLQYRLTRPLSIDFLRRLNRVANASTEHHILGKYLLLIATLNVQMNRFPPSLIASAAVYFERVVFHVKPYWNVNLKFYSKWNEEEVVECARELRLLFLFHQEEKRKFTTMWKLFSTHHNMKVSLIKNIPSF